MMTHNNGLQRLMVRYNNFRILLPPMGTSGLYCLTFHYHMHGFHINQLQLFTRFDGEENTVLWSDTGKKGNQWLTEKMFVKLTENAQVNFIVLTDVSLYIQRLGFASLA